MPHVDDRGAATVGLADEQDAELSYKGRESEPCSEVCLRSDLLVWGGEGGTHDVFSQC